MSLMYLHSVGECVLCKGLWDLGGQVAVERTRIFLQKFSLQHRCKEAVRQGEMLFAVPFSDPSWPTVKHGSKFCFPLPCQNTPQHLCHIMLTSMCTNTNVKPNTHIPACTAPPSLSSSVTTSSLAAMAFCRVVGVSSEWNFSAHILLTQYLKELTREERQWPEYSGEFKTNDRTLLLSATRWAE